MGTTLPSFIEVHEGSKNLWPTFKFLDGLQDGARNGRTLVLNSTSPYSVPHNKPHYYKHDILSNWIGPHLDIRNVQKQNFSIQILGHDKTFPAIRAQLSDSAYYLLYPK